MSDMSELQWRLSGGAANIDPLLSIGGAIASTSDASIILSKSIVRDTALIGGVTIDDSAGGAIGQWSMTYNASAKTLTVTPKGGAVGDAVDISVDGTYFVQGANDGGGIDVTVGAASLPGSNTSDTFTVANQTELILDDVTKVESNSGKDFYRCIALENTGSVADEDDKIDIEVWINSNTPGQDNIQIGVATQAASTGAGVSGTDFPALPADEFTAPAGVTFTAPSVEADALSMGTLSSTAGTTFVRFLHIKREVPVGVRIEDLKNHFSISIKALV